MGKAIIIAGDFSSKNIGTVNFISNAVPLESISITNKVATITNSYQLQKALAPSGTTQTLVVWESSNPAIATVTNEGLVTVLQTGQVTITCRSYFNAGISDTMTVSCVKELIAVTSISLTAPKTALSTGEVLTISVSKLPANAETGLTMSYQVTGDITIVSQNNSQVIIQAGETGGNWSVSGTTDNAVSNSISGTIQNVTVTAISLSAPKTALTVNEELLITVTKTPVDATIGTAITYTPTGPIQVVSSNDNGITIRATGEGSWSVSVLSANGKTNSISGTSSHIAVSSIALSAPKTDIAIDEELTISVAKMPSNATTGTTMSYTPTGPITIVSQNDSQVVIKGTGAGSWSIQGTTSNAVTKSISGTVSAVAITSVTLVASKAAPWDSGDVVTITAQITPANASLTNFVLSHSGAGTVTGQTATSITITADEEGTATVTALDGAIQIVSQNYAIVFTESDPSLVFQLDADGYTSGTSWPATVGAINATVLNATKENGMVRFYDNNTADEISSSMNVDLSTIINNTNDWTIFFDGNVPAVPLGGTSQTIFNVNIILIIQNGTNYRQAITLVQDRTTVTTGELIVRGINNNISYTFQAGEPFVSKVMVVKKNGKFNFYALKTNGEIMSILDWLQGATTELNAFMANPELKLTNRRPSWYAPGSDNSIKQIQVFNRPFALADVQAKFGV
jgi:hypothetical protein